MDKIDMEDDGVRRSVTMEFLKKISLKNDGYGQQTKTKDFDDLNQKDATSIFEYCRYAAAPEFYSKKFQQLCDTETISLGNTSKKDLFKFNYYVRFGFTKNFENTFNKPNPSLFVKKNDGSIYSSFLEFLSSFYKEIFPSSPLEKIEETIRYHRSFHIVLLFRKNKRKMNDSEDDIIIASVTFVVESEFILILWMGINQKLTFTKEFGNKETNKKKKNLTNNTVEKPFSKNFHIGMFLMHSVQKISQHLFEKKTMLPISLQCHSEIDCGPKAFYEKLFMYELFGEYGEPIIKKIEESFLSNLIYPINKETNLIWMMCVAPICLISNGWMHNEKYRTFLRKKQNLTDVISFIGYQSFIGTCNNLYYSKQMDQKQVLIDEINTSNECMEYLQNFKLLVPDGEEIQATNVYKFSLNINDNLKDDSSDSKLMPYPDDDVILKLLNKNENSEKKITLRDFGQGLLPYEGNCGFLIMSQFKFGYTKEYYPFRVFFSYLYKSFSQLPETHALFAENDDSPAWAVLKSTIAYDSESRITDFLYDKYKVSKKEKDSMYTAYRIPKMFGKKKWQPNYRERQQHLLSVQSFLIRNTKFWCSQLEYQIFQRIFDTRIFLLQAETKQLSRVNNLREWEMVLKGDFFEIGGQDLPIIESSDGRFNFLTLVEGGHFISLKVDSKHSSLDSNNEDIGKKMYLSHANDCFNFIDETVEKMSITKEINVDTITKEVQVDATSNVKKLKFPIEIVNNTEDKEPNQVNTDIADIVTEELVMDNVDIDPISNKALNESSILEKSNVSSDSSTSVTDDDTTESEESSKQKSVSESVESSKQKSVSLELQTGVVLPTMNKELNFPPKKIVIINNQNNSSDLDNETIPLKDLKSRQPKKLMKRALSKKKIISQKDMKRPKIRKANFVKVPKNKKNIGDNESNNNEDNNSEKSSLQSNVKNIDNDAEHDYEIISISSDDENSIQFLEQHIVDKMEEKKKKGLSLEKRQDWIRHAFEDDQLHKNATEMLRKEFLIEIKFLQAQRKILYKEKEKLEIELNQKNIRDRSKKKLTEKIEVWENKLDQNQAEIIETEWVMKRKPIFHKFDSILGIRKKKNNQYFAMIKKKDKICEVEMLPQWLDQLFEKEFLKHFKAFHNNGSWCCLGNTDDEISVVPKKNAEEILLTKEPIYRYVPEDKLDKLIRIRKIRFLVLFNQHVDTNEFVPIHTKIAVFCSNAIDDDYNKLTSHTYEIISETELKDEIDTNQVLDIKTLCYYQYQIVMSENKILDPIYCDPKDSDMLIENDNIIDDREFRFYFDVSHENFKLALEQPQVAKIMYDKLEEKFYGLSVTHYDNDGAKNIERFQLEESWIQKQYSEKIVEVVKKKAEKHYRGMWLQVPVGDVIDKRALQTIKYEVDAPTIHYKQGDDDRCAFCSLASALHIIDFKIIAEELIHYMTIFYTTIYEENFHRIMQSILQHLQIEIQYQPFMKKYTYQKIKCNKDGSYKDILQIDRKENFVYWLKLFQKDGSRSHVICVINNWIIDSNFDNGLKLSLENLNICCYKSSYVGICSGYVFRLHDRKKNNT